MGGALYLALAYLLFNTKKPWIPKQWNVHMYRKVAVVECCISRQVTQAIYRAAS